jgi:hypothetical protein
MTSFSRGSHAAVLPAAHEASIGRSRVREYRLNGYTDEAAIIKGFVRTSGVITTAGIIMCIAFGSALRSAALLKDADRGVGAQGAYAQLPGAVDSPSCGQGYACRGRLSRKRVRCADAARAGWLLPLLLRPAGQAPCRLPDRRLTRAALSGHLHRSHPPRACYHVCGTRTARCRAPLTRRDRSWADGTGGRATWDQRPRIRCVTVRTATCAVHAVHAVVASSWTMPPCPSSCLPLASSPRTRWARFARSRRCAYELIAAAGELRPGVSKDVLWDRRILRCVLSLVKVLHLRGAAPRGSQLGRAKVKSQSVMTVHGVWPPSTMRWVAALR